MEEELWRDVPTYQGIYQVSSLGNVKSISRKIFVNGGSYIRKGKILNQFSDRGYLKVHLYKNGKGKVWVVHKLVAMSFLNHIPCGMKKVVNHIDFNRSNNNVNNLEVISQRQNSNKKHIKSSSKYTGVFWHKSRNKWVSSIKIDGIQKNLGGFIDEYEAHLAYEKALKEKVEKQF